jgi:ubiquinone/menaquinone biosynthesis C-methylase UbiE
VAAGGDESAFWDRVAGRYDRLMRGLASRYDAVLDRLRRDLAGCDSALEVAAGTGLLTVTIAGTARRVVATDFSAPMLEELRKKLDALRVENVALLRRDARDLGFPAESFDAVVCGNALHLIPVPAEALAEMSRVLRPGGLLIAPTFCHGQSLAAKAVSRLMTLFSGFRVATRFSVASLGDLAAGQGLVVRTCENLGGLLPLAYLAAQKPR